MDGQKPIAVEVFQVYVNLYESAIYNVQIFLCFVALI